MTDESKTPNADKELDDVSGGRVEADLHARGVNRDLRAPHEIERDIRTRTPERE